MTAVASGALERTADRPARQDRRRRLIPVALALLSFALALAQSPGQVSFETKVDLHLEPVRFLGNVLSAWSPTGDLGHVQSGQYVGYLFPMGPFFAGGRLLGLPDWLVERLWLGVILSLGAWGIVRLLDALLARRRGIEHVIAGFAYVVNPYVVTIGNRTSVFLVAYAAVPWLLLAVHRGVRSPRSWWWPAALALILAASGGGVNAATVAWVLVAPALLLLYEVLVIGVPRAAALGFAWRGAVASLAASLWWIGGVAIGSLYGANFLPYIEQPGTIWQTTAVPEVLRGMGYWVSYAGVALAGHAVPLQSSASSMLFARPVVLASLLVPALAVTGFVWTRRWRYGPFMLAMLLVGVVIVVAGFPEGTPLRRGLHFIYNRAEFLQFLRTSYKAAPLIMLGVAALLGVALGEVWRRTSGRWARGALAAAVVALLAVAAWPLTSGNALGLRSHGVPTAWRHVAADLDRQLPANSRAIVLPSQLFSYYRWGATIDPVLPVLSTRLVAQRSITPYGDLHSTDLLWTVDRLVQQQRLYPGQLRPLLSLMGVRSVVAGTDDDRLRSGSVDPTVAASELAAQGLGRPARSYGRLRTFVTPPDQIYPSVRLGEVRRYDLSSTAGVVGVQPAGPATVVDGSAEGLAGLATFGALPPSTPVFYAGDLSGTRLNSLTSDGAEVVITDSNRRRVFVNSLVDQVLGPTVGASDSFSADAPVLNPFAALGTADQTVQVLHGARYIRAPYSPGFVLFPEHRPFAAFDNSPTTAWLADPSLDPSRRWIEIGFDSPRDVPFIDLLPYNDSRGTVHAVDIAGRRFRVHPGWNHLVLSLHRVSALRVRIGAVGIPQRRPGGAGGLAEIRVPGAHVSEALRAPIRVERELAGHDLGHVGLTYLFERTTGDDPLHRMRGHGAWEAGSVRDAGDGETGLARLFTPSAARSWSADAWLSLSPTTPDSELDRLAGYPGPVAADSSGRFLNEGRFRASSAFDGSGSTAWLGELDPGSRPWIAWRLPRPITVRRLRLTQPEFPVQVPARVSLSVDGHAGPAMTVGPDGSVTLSAAVRGRHFRLEVLATRVPAGRGAANVRGRRAVGIAEIEGAGVPRMIVARRGVLHAGCGIARFDLGGRSVPLRVDSGITSLDAGDALRATHCSRATVLGSGTHLLSAASGVFRIDWLRLVSPPPAGLPAPSGGGRVLDPGHSGNTSVTGARVALNGRSWLVLGQSYDSGWHATCDGHSLGSPVVINGYANGWSAPASCRAVSFAFAPQRTLVWLYALSAVAVVVCLLLLLLRRRPVSAPTRAELSPAETGTPRQPARSAVALGALAGLVLGFIFSIRSGLVIAPVVAVVAWRGIGPRPLTLAAGALLLIAVPAIYMFDLPPNQGGFDFTYSIDLIAAHWVAVAAIVFLTIALARALIELRGRRRSAAGSS